MAVFFFCVCLMFVILLTLCPFKLPDEEQMRPAFREHGSDDHPSA